MLRGVWVQGEPKGGLPRLVWEHWWWPTLLAAGAEKGRARLSLPTALGLVPLVLWGGQQIAGMVWLLGGGR